MTRHSFRHFFLCLLGSVVATCAGAAAPYEEKMLALPPAKQAASIRNCDQFYRVIVWPARRQPSAAISIYVSKETPKLPERGFIYFKEQKIDGTFWERSRPLTTKEVETISSLFESEEVFSLSAAPWLNEEYQRTKKGLSGPGVNYFVHIDKIRHRSKEVRRVIGVSNPAQRVIDGLLEVIKDYLEAYDRDSGSPRGAWEAEEKAKSK